MCNVYVKFLTCYCREATFQLAKRLIFGTSLRVFVCVSVCVCPQMILNLFRNYIYFHLCINFCHEIHMQVILLYFRTNEVVKGIHFIFGYPHYPQIFFLYPQFFRIFVKLDCSKWLRLLSVSDARPRQKFKYQGIPFKQKTFWVVKKNFWGSQKIV